MAAAEAAYAAAWREATGTEVPGDPADACVGWLIRGDALVPQARRGTRDYLARAVRRDWRWGACSARERLRHRLGVVAGLTADHPRLSEVGALTGALLGAVESRWPALRPLPATCGPRADA
ncbi:hypothetical protein [Actinacidiphila sp. ITFR-21]|uniref:hypothetical protein n=1 Tax=Actinacidiphila sp. ITFR-21 TaxID=3075199 RepID=UPI00288A73EF|nr:hypothetical protein [Streptomyces sp. ITFR-21]WNI19272.1 hypothetical protein RLT57_29475 [Streptomyces sp. ITFR-21]